VRLLRRVAAAGMVAVLLGGCSAAVEPSAEQLQCVEVNAVLRSDLSVSRAAAHVAPSRSSAWIIAAPNGALWVTTDPPDVDVSRVVLPLNQQARSTSSMGAGVDASAPIYQGITDREDGVRQAIACLEMP
jgi:hypothetical protein